MLPFGVGPGLDVPLVSAAAGDPDGGADEGATADGPSGRSSGDAADAVLAVEGVSVSYDRVSALRDVSLSIGEGEIVSVIGPNGAGKTTLAEAVSGFLPYEGSVRYRGTEVSGVSQTDLVGDGVVHCTETRDLFGYMDVADNLRLGAYRRAVDADERLDRVYDLFPRLRERADQNARTMSGGEQQMLAIGRALMGDPDLLVLDEPTLGLAPVILADISDALGRIRDAGVTVLLCEQNVTFAMDHADRIHLLENGEVVTEGRPETLADDDYVRDVYLGT